MRHTLPRGSPVADDDGRSPWRYAHTATCGNDRDFDGAPAERRRPPHLSRGQRLVGLRALHCVPAGFGAESEGEIWVRHHASQLWEDNSKRLVFVNQQ